MEERQDLISRQAEIDAVENEMCIFYDCDVLEKLKDLPPAQQNLQPTCNNLATDTISRQAAIGAVLGVIPYDEYWKEQIEKAVNKLPSAQPDLIAKIQNGINATNANDSYSCGMRNGMRWCISLIDDKEPLYENCPSAQPEPAIPLQWIEAQIEWLKSLDNAFSTLTALQISAMVNKWKGEQDV